MYFRLRTFATEYTPRTGPTAIFMPLPHQHLCYRIAFYLPVAALGHCIMKASHSTIVHTPNIGMHAQSGPRCRPRTSTFGRTLFRPARSSSRQNPLLASLSAARSVLTLRCNAMHITSSHA